MCWIWWSNHRGLKITTINSWHMMFLICSQSNPFAYHQSENKIRANHSCRMHFVEKGHAFWQKSIGGYSHQKRANFYGYQALDPAEKAFVRVHAVSNQNFCHPAHRKVIFSGNFKRKTVQQATVGEHFGEKYLFEWIYSIYLLKFDWNLREIGAFRIKKGNQ